MIPNPGDAAITSGIAILALHRVGVTRPPIAYT
jgi:hypothetical protein